LVAVLPLAGLGLFVEGPLELVFVGASMVLATGSLCWGFRTHRHASVFAVLATAVGMIIVGRLLAAEPYELGLVVVGAVLLAGGHLLNRYLCRTCHRCQEDIAHEST
jgi:hypothetical protein